MTLTDQQVGVGGSVVKPPRQWVDYEVALVVGVYDSPLELTKKYFLKGLQRHLLKILYTNCILCLYLNV